MTNFYKKATLTGIASSAALATILAGAQSSLAQSQVTCESNDSRRESCQMDTRYGVEIDKQYSQTSCTGRWGFGRDYVWVEDGCRAMFKAASDQDDRYDGGRYSNDNERNRPPHQSGGYSNGNDNERNRPPRPAGGYSNNNDNDRNQPPRPPRPPGGYSNNNDNDRNRPPRPLGGYSNGNDNERNQPPRPPRSPGGYSNDGDKR